MSIVLKLSVILTVRCFCQSNEMIEWDGSSLNLFSVCIRSNRLRNCDVGFFALEFRTNMLVLLTHRNGFWLFANFGKKISGSTTFHLIQNTAHLTTKKTFILASDHTLKHKKHAKLFASIPFSHNKLSFGVLCFRSLRASLATAKRCAINHW